MSEEKSLIEIDLGSLTKPATILIERVSDMVGAVFKPVQLKRMARAEAEADKIKALAAFDLGTEIEHRAMQRLIHEESRKQENIESITLQAVQNLDEDASPEKIEDDWITFFFEKCRLISEPEMQSLWAKLLAGQANSPNSFSKRTVDLVNTLDKDDANLFTLLNSFSWRVDGPYPLIYQYDDHIFYDNGLYYNSLMHLSSIGLISFDAATIQTKLYLPKKVTVEYFDDAIDLEFENEQDNVLQLGQVVLTLVGMELATICGSTPIDGFVEYVLRKFRGLGYLSSSPLPRQKK